MQEMKEKELKYLGNGDANSHMCKVCFESPTAAILLPCRHFCCKWFEPPQVPPSSFPNGCNFLMVTPILPFFAVCKSCSLACSECPLCRTKIADRLFAFTS